MILKIVFAILASVAIIGCEEGPGGGGGSGGGGGGVGGGGSINPPSWIIGTWTGPGGTITWTFTSNSAVHTASALSTSIKLGAGGIESSGYVRLSDSTEPDGQTTRYRIFYVANIPASGGVPAQTLSQTYTFEKRETDRMGYSLTQSGITQGPFSFTKR